ncbi:MAG: hypothetical protein ACYS67_09350 [Planctomycetota bacterium]
MKKILLALVVLVFAAPAMADVIITAVQTPDTNEVIISFDATSETNLVRAFSIDIQLDNDANVVSVEGLSADYWVYPGTIQIAADGTVTTLGSIAAEYGDLPGDTLIGPPDGNGVTLEAASLYAPVGPGSPNAPAKSGDLAKIILDADTCITLSANVSRAGPTGVVMENPDEVVTVVYPSTCVTYEHPVDHECMKTTAQEYPVWEAWGKPACWCYSKQCRGDATGTALGPYWVQLADLNILKAGWYQVDTVLATVQDGICGDFNHAALGPYRVQLADLNILKTYWYSTVVPDCDPANYNFWETP